MLQQITSCDETQCFVVAEHFLDFFSDDPEVNKFDRVILDVSRVYDTAILVGAMAASKYIQPPVQPRVTFDVDVLLEEADFEAFLEDDIASEKSVVLDQCFETSDSAGHSLRHRKTRLYVDFLSAESRPVSGKLMRWILENREKSTNILSFGGRGISILKPEYIIAMKLHRYTKDPRSEKGLSDRLDIVKMLKTHHGYPHVIDTEKIPTLLRRREIPHFEEMMADVEQEMRAA
ncbi:hypothetical protein HNR65_003000 [Desulfosalsimonas propionicica]|uniref:Uncharacterized protein n=1 Tax=Desulfosalsimonas propionicica TaxID=332175 RepID=A0A7W0CBF4_9BACT|nr:hypothetical protein [Desulfosalsimonas propionicica]MBA2882646.1 hypothetical protein [Desulfosalsimonas propionicica]